jgi:hypothetical protein
MLSARELCSRLSQILDDIPTPFLASNVLLPSNEPRGSTSSVDNHYLHYKLVSSVYRLAAFLGWLELYRQEIVFLNSGRDRTNAKLAEVLAALRDCLADGRLNTADDWESWHDRLLFREEQRAVGETMILREGDSRTIVGYAAFYRAFVEATRGEPGLPFPQWILAITSILLDLGLPAKDFRIERLRQLLLRLIQLIELLEDGALHDSLRKMRVQHQKPKLSPKPTTQRALP